MATKIIDVSYAQGNINWSKVKESGINGAIIRATAYYPKNGKTGIDKYFKKNITEATESGIKVGVYHYSYATTVEEGILEAKHFLNTIKNYKIEYPVILDFEDSIQTSLSKTVKADICNAFLQVIEKAGYYGMLYSMAFWLEYQLNDSRLNKYDKWVAHIGVSKPFYSGNYGIWQYSWTGRINGINGDVDLNYVYKDYPTIIYNAGLNNLKDTVTTNDWETGYTDYKTLYELEKLKYNTLINNIKNIINQ